MLIAANYFCMYWGFDIFWGNGRSRKLIELDFSNSNEVNFILNTLKNKDRFSIHVVKEI